VAGVSTIAVVHHHIEERVSVALGAARGTECPAVMAATPEVNQGIMEIDGIVATETAREPRVAGGRVVMVAGAIVRAGKVVRARVVMIDRVPIVTIGRTGQSAWNGPGSG
jgi:hypothetical protein